MLTRALKWVYSRIPGIRELLQISEAANETRNRAIRIDEYARRLEAMETFRLTEFELPRHARFSDPRRLIRHGFSVCSQNGEDGMICEIFRRVAVGGRIFAEVGIGDGTENNTAFLLTQGWRGFWIDGNAAFLKTIEGRGDLGGGSLKSVVALVSRENIAAHFESLGIPREFDLLSLDIDQNTYYVWEGLSDFRPRVVVIEYNAAIPPHMDWKVSYDATRVWDGSRNWGASLKALEILGRRLGYSLVGCDICGVNAFFVRDELVADKFAPPFTSENHYEPPRYFSFPRKAFHGAIFDRAG